MISEASLSALEAFCSPSAAMTCKEDDLLLNCPIITVIITNYLNISTYLSSGLSGSFSLCSHGSLELNRQPGIFAVIVK